MIVVPVPVPALGSVAVDDSEDGDACYVRVVAHGTAASLCTPGALSAVLNKRVVVVHAYSGDDIAAEEAHEVGMGTRALVEPVQVAVPATNSSAGSCVTVCRP